MTAGAAALQSTAAVVASAAMDRLDFASARVTSFGGGRFDRVEDVPPVFEGVPSDEPGFG